MGTPLAASLNTESVLMMDLFQQALHIYGYSFELQTKEVADLLGSGYKEYKYHPKKNTHSNSNLKKSYTLQLHANTTIIKHLFKGKI